MLKNANNCFNFNIHEQDEFHARLSSIPCSVEVSMNLFYNLGAWSSLLLFYLTIKRLGCFCNSNGRYIVVEVKMTPI